MVNNVLAGVRDFLLILVLIAAIVFGARFLLAIDQLGDAVGTAPAAVDQPCERDPLLPGCGLTPPGGNPMIKRIGAALLALVLSLAGVVATSSPAQAATINGCDPARVCLYDWTGNNYASGFWQRPMYGANSLLSAGCTNLSNHQWHDLNGSPNNTASSMILNGYSDRDYVVQFYDLAGCVPSSFSVDFLVEGNALIIENNLADLDSGACSSGGCQLNWYDRFSSVRVYRR